tara:strand:- start:3093 stop:3746 length:654 start_codon:yes stop_codon:yes gene_type:complete
MKRSISYLRASVSELAQPNSLEVQRAIIQSFADRAGYIIEREYNEYGSGCNDDRLEWASAIAYAEANDVYIICWKVDRFSRSLSSFSKSSSLLTRLRFVELGDIEPSPMVMAVLVAVGQNEAQNARIRIKETMRILKERDGRIWGNPRIQETASPVSLKVRQSNARVFNSRISNLVDDFKRAGYSLKASVVRLNELGITTRRGRPWTYHLLYRVVNY